MNCVQKIWTQFYIYLKNFVLWYKIFYNKRIRDDFVVNFMGKRVPKKTATIAMCCIITILITCIFCICYLALTKFNAQNTTHITVEIVYADSSIQEFKIDSAGATLEEALLDEGLIESSEQQTGVYTVIDGVVAENGATWQILIDGEATDSKLADIQISNGDRYQIVYTH